MMRLNRSSGTRNHAGTAAMAEEGIDRCRLLLHGKGDGLVGTYVAADSASGTGGFVYRSCDGLDLQSLPVGQSRKNITGHRHSLTDGASNVHGRLAGARQIDASHLTLLRIQSAMQLLEEAKLVRRRVEKFAQAGSRLGANDRGTEYDHVGCEFPGRAGRVPVLNGMTAIRRRDAHLCDVAVAQELGVWMVAGVLVERVLLFAGNDQLFVEVVNSAGRQFFP